ncbi:hypothetical protein WJX73_009636 [Symbiochloris irregularis]|uniref:Anaphase-promoting complex subunit 4 n=1 Tax=Symbiochloris irregularis TaxID=706552 RepID=A0AAW1NIU7_9CHLO
MEPYHGLTCTANSGWTAQPAQALPDPPLASVVEARMARDMRHLAVIYSEAELGSKGQSTGSTRSLHLQIMDTGPMHESRSELLQLAQLASSLPAVLTGAQSALKAAETEWTAAMTSLEQQLVDLGRLLRDNSSTVAAGQQTPPNPSATPSTNPSSRPARSSARIAGRGVQPEAEPQTPLLQTPSKPSNQQTAKHEEAVDELVILLAAGHLRPGMRQFLTSSLGDAGIKRLARKIDGAVRLLCNTLCDSFQPALHQATLLLSHLQGLALSAVHLESLRHQVPALRAIQAQLLALEITAESCRLRTASTGAQYRQFLAWLMRVWQQQMGAAESAQAPQGALLKPHVATALLSFLEGQLLDDCIAAQVFGKGGQQGSIVCPDLSHPDMQAILTGGSVPAGDESSRTTAWRSLGAESALPFAVSGPRGVAAVVQQGVGPQRGAGAKVLLFDLEENEDAGDDESADDGGNDDDGDSDEDFADPMEVQDLSRF